MSDIDTIREALKQWAIAMVDDFRWAHEHAMELATATHGPMPEGYDDDDEPDTPWHCFYDGAMTMFNDVRAKKPASTEPPSYVYSRDYEALYDLLMRGGEAIVIEQWPNGEQARRLNRRYLFGRSDAEPDTTKEFAINLWRRLDLEWIAPSTEPRLTVEQAWPYLQHKKGCNMLSFTNSMMSHAPISQRLCDCGLDELRSSLTKAAKP